MTTLLVIVAMILLCGGFLWHKSKRLDKWRDALQEGELCEIYIGENRTSGVVVGVVDNVVLVQDFVLGEVHKRFKEDVYCS